MINVYDDVFTVEENRYLYNEILYKNKFCYGETDSYGLPPTGMILDIKDTSFYDTFYKIVISKNNSIETMGKARGYVNLFLPNENPYYHTDGNVLTCLFYLDLNFDMQSGGETMFRLDNGEVIAVESKPSRLVMFDGNILHRATSFRNKPRLTVALKFFKIN